MPESLATGLLTLVAPPAVTPRYIGYWLVDDDRWAAAYLDDAGELIEWIGTTVPGPTSIPEVSLCTPIRIDESDTVGAASLIQPANTTLEVFDFVAGQPRHTWSTSGPIVEGAAYVDGQVYALTHARADGPTSRVELVRLETDLSAPSTVATIDLAPPGGLTQFARFYRAVSVAFGRSSAWICVLWDDFGIFREGWQAGQLNYDGTAEQADASAYSPDEIGEDSGVAMPYGAVQAIRGRRRWLGGLGNALDSPAWELWGTTMVGDEGGPSDDYAAVYDPVTRALVEADPDNVGAPAPVEVPFEFIHPDYGTIGAPRLIFPAGV
ncbi:MAG: hypothetical protein AAGM22_22675 [Acidobacteriota bacterium]